MNDDQPDLQELAALAREGRRELEQLDRTTDTRRWAAIEARLGPATTPAVDTLDAQPSRTSATWWPLTAVAAVALVVGLAIGGVLSQTSDTTPATLATIDLAPLTDAAAPATAALRQGPDGRTIAVDLDLPVTDGFHEVWLLAPDTGALVSLGPVRADGTYVVPDTVDLVELPVLDVSVEPRDGDPAHSGDSVLRGAVTWLG